MTRSRKFKKFNVCLLNWIQWAISEVYNRIPGDLPVSLDPTPISNVYMPVETLIRRAPKALQEQGWAFMHHIVYSVDWLQLRNGFHEVPWWTNQAEFTFCHQAHIKSTWLHLVINHWWWENIFPVLQWSAHRKIVATPCLLSQHVFCASFGTLAHLHAWEADVRNHACVIHNL